MKRRWLGAVALLLAAGCELEDGGLNGVEDGAPPVAVDASYYGGAVTVTWELANDWDGETFRVYGKRSTDARYVMLAEVTSCTNGFCSYVDTNVEPGRSYDY